MSAALWIMALNEEESLPRFLEAADLRLFDEVLLVDGGSTDGTVDIGRSHGLRVIEQQRKGLRNAYWEAYDVCSSDLVVTVSPDGNCDPRFLAELLGRARCGFDLVIGSRYAGGMTSEDDDLLTSFGNRVFRVVNAALFGGGIMDPIVIYRCFRRDIVPRLGLLDARIFDVPDRLLSTTLSWEPLMTARALRYGLSVTEVPCGEPARFAGERKLQVWRWGLGYLLQYFLELFHPKRSWAAPSERTV